MSVNSFTCGNWDEINRHAVASLAKLVPAHAPVDALKEAKVRHLHLCAKNISAPLFLGHPPDGAA